MLQQIYIKINPVLLDYFSKNINIIFLETKILRSTAVFNIDNN